MHYRIAKFENPFAADLIDKTLDWLGEQKKMEKEHEELVEVCCSVNVPVTIARAPKPETLVEREEPINVHKESDIETYLL